MSEHSIDEAITLARVHNLKHDLHEPQSEDRVYRAQQALGLIFPPSYESFVRRFGCGGIGGQYFYGVVGDDFTNSSAPDGIWVTLDHRKGGYIPKDLIVVGDCGDGAVYALDTSQRQADGECPVIEWWPGAEEEDQSREPIAEDFGAFFLQETREVVERRREQGGKAPG
jgi:hypothetical protein